jgi:putative flippase GtrA
MALVTNHLGSTLTRKARSKLGVRFGRFAVAAIAAFATTEIVYTICFSLFSLSATWATLVSWFSGAVVSYILSRWAWKRKGRPNLLKETLPFWIVSAMVVSILTVANKFGYHSATWLHLRGFERGAYLDVIYGGANFVTFLLRFLFFHYVLFAGSADKAAPAVVEEAVASTDPGPFNVPGDPDPSGPAD